MNHETTATAVDLDRANGPFMEAHLPVDMKRVPPAPRLTLPAHLEAMLARVDTSDRTATLIFPSEALKAKDTGKHTSTREMTSTGIWSEVDPSLASAGPRPETRLHARSIPRDLT